MNESKPVSNFIRNIIDADLAQDKFRSRRWSGKPGPAASHADAPPDGQKIRTRFPPEPNGYLHFGHAKSICLNFGLARDYGGACHLRFDDTNPEKEEQEYVDSIVDAVKWLGFDWGDHLYYASNYFDWMYGFAEYLIQAGHAYVDSQSAEEMRASRGSLSEPGKESPFRDRSPQESLDLFRRMKAGEFPDGLHVLRAKIDMAAPNINLRDPAIYRIRHAEHHNTGNKWCIYPMYTYAHPIEDALENITHSICTLEFEDQRPFYDWLLERLAEGGLLQRPLPQQIEFARLNLTYLVMSKRKLIQLVEEGHVTGWDDPRMSTLVGGRRRGYTPEGFRLFAERIGVTKADSLIDYSVLEGCMREHLENSAPRVMAVIDPLRVTLTNYQPGVSGNREAGFHPNHPEFGSREVPLAQTLWIEREDFAEVPPEGWQRLTAGGEVRLRYSYVIKCDEVVKDAAGKVVELKCSLDPDTLGKNPQGRKVKGVIHWVSAEHGLAAEIRLYDRLFTVPQPDKDAEKTFIDFLNPDSLKIVQGWVEPCVKDCLPETRYQFERLGYFVADRRDHQPGGKLVFNRTVGLKDSWTKEQG